MAGSGVRISSTGSGDLERLAATMRGADKDLRRRLTAALRAEGRPLERAVQAAVRNVPVRGIAGGGSAQRLRAGVDRSRRRDAARRRLTRGGTGLRDTIARATKASVRTGGRGVRLTIRVEAAQLGRQQAKLPRYLDSERGWRHPVYGNRNVWVRQTGAPWFAVTIDKHAAGVTRALHAAAREFARDLT